MKLNPTSQRVAALALLGVLVAIVATGAVVPVVGMFTRAAQSTTELRAQLAHFSLLAGNNAVLEEQLKKLQKRDPASAYFLTGNTPALALAKMQQLVKQIAEQSGGQVVSTQTVDVESAETGPIPVSMRVHLRGDVAALLQLLHTLEGGRPMLFLDNVVVTANPAGQSLVDSGPDAAVLDIRFDLLGYLRRVPT